MDNIISDVNLGIRICMNASPQRNAVLLCGEVDYSFKYLELPRPRQLFNHIIDCQSTCIIRE